MSFKTNPQSFVHLSTTNAEEYFCTICVTASGEPRKIPESNEQFVDVKMTKAQALQLCEQLQLLLEDE
ncbi:hypothetical protein LC593_33645 [Nostoc sp. CHAB 5844]|nr:hypothetical protein [Nostoc sp. CHAB 5844]